VSGKNKNAQARLDKILEEIDGACLSYGISGPHVYLVELAAGKDPRYDTSQLYDLIYHIAKREELPDSEEWAEIKRLVLGNPAYQYERPPTSVSLDAAKELAKVYIPKQKALEVTVEDVTPREIPKPTKEEIEEFKRILDGEDDDIL